MLNISKDFEKFIKEYGRPVLLVRHADKVKCTCWNMKFQAPDPHCQICLGTGHIFKAEKWLTREETTSIPESLARAIRDTDLGNITVPSRVYYFPKQAVPDIEDYIIDCSWESETKPVFDKYSSVYIINHIDPYRVKGEIQYFRASCKFNPINFSDIKAYITSKSGNVIMYKTVIGVGK